MFGYVMADTAALSEEENARYRSFYCGLCRSLRKNCGNISRMTLNYDLTFLSLFLSAVYDDRTEPEYKKCALHPFTKNPSLENGFSDYAAYMNVVLCYYKFLDDWNDDRSFAALTKAKIFENAVKKAEKLYPRQCKKTADDLLTLAKIEKDNVLNPDVPAAVFGDIMGSLFAVKKDEKAEKLYAFGFALGKFIYITDAANDFEKDLKKQNYNPLAAHSSAEFGDMINLLMADVVSAYKKLEIKRDNTIIENILFSGILLKYNISGRKHKNGSGPV